LLELIKIEANDLSVKPGGDEDHSFRNDEKK
jgi:hypothetical protein